jgi:hypothetical protein
MPFAKVTSGKGLTGFMRPERRFSNFRRSATDSPLNVQRASQSVRLALGLLQSMVLDFLTFSSCGQQVPHV